jgi:hypothetical protein
MGGQRSIVDVKATFLSFANEVAIEELSYCHGLELTYCAFFA